ncbi:lethal(3)malignant brain tumor-like protein 4 isoform X1 [Mus musculus]|uniref:L3MBTL4 histone methyl-lysine binding protein n=1 Tax=Mus musculus TaxID=10090 RepID=A0A0A0MQK6_MOUSE|nr:lethal(3)malignant brain tumor-like protein 4 isoform X1 [Mus musculus]XP_006524480.1 lethal(3)malignant brain tumor-like protein 4 isoform X1 [Mus musculus]XP_036016541.1 lethal(3)malignant brain tumor-like protein 4 isoform X1 [Mus musculus]|eukprot:XP_006524479.1 PREDICTED: lethal(3)malignant brain tumor-like protein 4 isoform X1 [Mus musculus]
MRQPNRKRKLSLESTERMNQDRCTGQTEEEKKPGEVTTPSKRESSVTTAETWSWEQYLREGNAVAAPVELFSKDQSFPEHENGFQVGMRLEGIDARRPSVFCVLSVAEVCGYRLRLHFDGYLSCYDFWTNAGSPDIHPVGWCQKTKHELHIPRDYRKDKFVWMDYLKACRLQNAPKKLFRNRSSNGPVPREFQVGMKLEAVDRRNPCLMCVATIADIVEDRVRVHFDSLDDSFDYWCDVNSPYIQPVGWCQENGRTLVAPQGYPHPDKFSWTDYLRASQSKAVPAKAFGMRTPHGFLPNMKLEAVDKRNPQLIRVATIADVDDYRVKIHFDGWDHKYDYWVDADSQDIHPIGWCDVTGHPLEVPYGSKHVKILPGQPACPTPGCRGIGHIRGPRYAGHHSAFGCPYSDVNLKREAALQDRLREQTQANLELDPSHSKSENPCNLNVNGKCENANSQCRLVQQAKCLKIKGKEDIDLDNLFREYSAAQVQQMLHQPLSMTSTSAHPFRDIPLSREQHCKLLPGVADIQASQVARWTVDEVAEFVQSLLGCEEHAKCFKKEQIDGKAFLLLTQADIVKVMRIKLGPALKIYNSILMFRNSQDVTEDASSQEDKR